MWRQFGSKLIRHIGGYRCVVHITASKPFVGVFLTPEDEYSPYIFGNTIEETQRKVIAALKEHIIVLLDENAKLLKSFGD